MQLLNSFIENLNAKNAPTSHNFIYTYPTPYNGIKWHINIHNYS